MNKVLFRSNLLSELPGRGLSEKMGYSVVSDFNLEDIPELCAADKSIHALIMDADMADLRFIGRVRAAVGDGMFPIILLSKNISDAEAGRWLSCGVTDIFGLPMSVPIMDKRIGSLIQLFRISRSLSDQSRDKLTGLMIRNAFLHFAQERIRENPQYEYLVIISDIEQFKRINERFGYEKGSELLAYVGAYLGAMNSDDVLFARYSGDRFVGLVRIPDGVNPAGDMSLVEESMKMLYKNAPIDHFTVKFGIYYPVDKSLSVAAMCDRAIMALNTIKGQYGSDYAAYSQLLQQKYNREHRIIDSMETALESGQFSVYYQPKHDIKSSKIVGVEALVRWQHPEYGFMSPGEFIPLFERTGFIYRLDKYVWNKVCEDLRQWIDEGITPVPVSVNASRRDFLQKKFFAAIEEPMKKYNVAPELFHVEVTESIYMEDAKILTPILSRIREMGIKIELDDFGSGFSSLGILSNLPLDTIKLDISIVRSLEKHPLMVESIIRMMHNLGYSVTAEGVETAAQLELLSKMDCDSVQGYYYSRPLTLSGLKEYISSYTDTI